MFQNSINTKQENTKHIAFFAQAFGVKNIARKIETKKWNDKSVTKMTNVVGIKTLRKH